MTAMPRAETIEELTKVTTTERPQSLPRVVILGAGFGGLTTATGLRKAPVSITVIDR